MKEFFITQGFGALFAGVLAGGVLVFVLLHGVNSLPLLGGYDHNHHPIADPFDSEYHVHADFHIIVHGEQIDLAQDAYMTTAEQKLHDDLHLHDGNGEVEHIHIEEETFATFLTSLDFTLTDSCLTLDTGEEYCSGATEEVLLFVNDELYTEPISTYIPADEDRVLLYYGTYEPEVIQPYLEAIPADACYYSGTCPERGIAPPESCGLTCEL